MNFERITWFR